MRWVGWICVGLLVAAGAGVAHEGHGKEITWDLALRDRDCEGNRTLCFLPYMGEPKPVHGAQILVLLMRNDNDLEHNVRVTTLSEADPERRDTTVANPLAASHDLPRGVLRGTSFVVPTTIQDLYIWCDTPGHEEAGMWFNATVLPAEKKESPAPFALLAVLLLGLAMSQRRREWA